MKKMETDRSPSVRYDVCMDGMIDYDSLVMLIMHLKRHVLRMARAEFNRGVLSETLGVEVAKYGVPYT